MLEKLNLLEKELDNTLDPMGSPQKKLPAWCQRFMTSSI